MKPPRIVRAALLLVWGLTWASAVSVQAQEAPAAAAAVQRGRALSAELEAGGLDPARLAALYAELAAARAHAGDDEGARAAFIASLALDPDLRVDPSEPLEVRSPYLEARGFWSVHRERLAVRAAPSPGGDRLEVELTDPAELVSRLVVRTRPVGASRYVEVAQPRSARLSVPLEPSASTQGLEYTIVLLDGFGNRLSEAGSERDPLRWAPPRPAAPAPVPQLAGVTTSAPPATEVAPDTVIGAPRRRRRMQAAAAGAFVASAALGVAGALEHRERERLAQLWNRGECAGDGETRAELCSSERRDLDRAERIAIGMYAGAAGALALGAVLLIVAPERERDARGTRARLPGCQLGVLGSVQCVVRF